MTQKTVPLYYGLPGDPNRKLIGESVVDDETGKVISTITNVADAAPFPIGTKLSVDLADTMPESYVLAKEFSIAPKDEP